MALRDSTLRFRYLTHPALAIAFALSGLGAAAGHARADAAADRAVADGDAVPCGAHDPFLCYSTRALVERRTVTLADRFESGRFEVRQVKRFCPPASVNDAVIADPETHLDVYRLRGPHTRRFRIPVTNRFGTFLIDTLRTEALMVPSA